MNNLTAGLLASGELARVHVDLGPNLSITASLATILWPIVIRREGAVVSFWQFMGVGLVVMPPTFILAVCARLIIG